jgi:hypothetical protein
MPSGTIESSGVSYQSKDVEEWSRFFFQKNTIFHSISPYSSSFSLEGLDSSRKSLDISEETYIETNSTVVGLALDFPNLKILS